MEREQARQEIRANWRRIITSYTGTARQRVSGKETYICPFCGHGTHGDGIKDNPKSADGYGMKCFGGGCTFSGDILDFIQRVRGIGYNEALKEAGAIIGIKIDPYTPPGAFDFGDTITADTRRNPETSAQNGAGRPKAPAGDNLPVAGAKAPENGDQAPPYAQGTAPRDYTAYYKECAGRINDPAAVSYLTARGISTETAVKYGLGYDPAWISPATVARMEQERKTWRPDPTPRLIVPITANHYIARDTRASADREAAARKGDPAFKDYRKMNETGGGSIGFFNMQAVKEAAAVFVVEGVFDALSVIEAGGVSVAINSANNADRFIKDYAETGSRAPLIVCLDNDTAGRKAAQTMKDGAERLQVGYIMADIAGDFKDANERLQADRAGLVQAVADAMGQAAEQAGAQLPGLMTYDDAIDIFQNADDRILELKTFPAFSKTAKIKIHDSVVIAADTGAGKSSLALNFLNDLNEAYPCIYFNLEMDTLDVMRRLAAIHSGIELDRIEGYKHDERTAAAVNISLRAITNRKPLQVIQGAYMLQDIESIIKRSIQDRKEPTIVFIDHSLLVDTKKNTGGRYDRFTQISEGLRKVALKYDVILFVLLQQSRAGKSEENERPKNSSLKESGSWENDATQICFLWYDPTDKRKKLLMTKNRHGIGGEFTLNYWAKTQTYAESDGKGQAPRTEPATRPASKRDRQRLKLENAYRDAYIMTDGNPTLRAMAEAADVTTATVKGWIKEYGGCTVDGLQQDPAGIDTEVEYTGFIKLTPGDGNPFDINNLELPETKTEGRRR